MHNHPPTTRNGEDLAHKGPGKRGAGGEHRRARLTQGQRCLLFRRVWRLLQEESGESGWGGGAKGPERQMSPISVLPLVGLRQLGTSQGGRTGWGTRPLGDPFPTLAECCLQTR